MTQLHKQWLTWAILTAVVLAISLVFGITYPLPEQPTEPPEQIVPLGGNFSNPIDIEGTSSAAAPAITFEDDTDSGFFRSAANTLNVSAGGTEQLEIDATSITLVPTLDLDGPLDIDTTGSIDLTSTEAAADAIFLDANGTVTTGIDIDLGSVSGMTIDGGMVDIGGGTCGVADGDNDVCIAAVLEVDGELEADGNIDADADLDVDGTANLDDVDIDLSASLNIDGHMVDIGTCSTPTTADGDNDLCVAADAEIDGVLDLDGSIMYPAEDVTEANVLTAAECGKIMWLNSATEFQTTLPAVSTVSAGCEFRFIVKAAPSGADYTILTGNDDEDVLIGGINELEVDTGDDGPYDASADTITFANGVSVVGDWVYMVSDGTMFYVTGQANADGGVTITDSD